jgi:ribosomal protein S18 acetylase RimI-like enzyme
MNKKLILIAIFGLYIPFSGLAMESTTQESVKPHISNFNPERDMQPVMGIFNKNHQTLSSDPSPSAYQAELLKCHDHPGCDIKILQENEKLAGYVKYKKNSLDEGYISQVAVSDDFRNKGYGKFLVSTALKELHNMDANSTTLLCYKDNIPALNLYEKMGFKKEFEAKDGINGRDLILLKHTSYPLIHTCISEKLPTEIFDQPWNF